MNSLHSIQFTLTSLIAGLEALAIAHQSLRAKALAVRDITLDSRQSNEQTIFIALKGAVADGHDYIENAISNGCKFILCESLPKQRASELAHEHDCELLAVDRLKSRLADLLFSLYLEKTSETKGTSGTSKLPIITAVTGTNGKTSVASLHAQLALTNAMQSACLGTLGLTLFKREGDQVIVTNVPTAGESTLGLNTTVDIITQYKILALLQQQNIDSYCLEASSHGIEQQRLVGLPISTAIFTNLTQDHLDYHGNMQAYASAKRSLLNYSSISKVVLNADDTESQNWFACLTKVTTVAWFALQADKIPDEAEHYCVASKLKFTPSGIEFELSSSWGNALVNCPLLGEFNISNILAALCARLLAGDDFAALITQISRVQGVHGRMELFVNDCQKANVIVDYAHTPDALKQALAAARRHTTGKLFCVFGCGGNRDITKRPIMGEYASRMSDVVVLTQDNTRNESAQQILKDIQAGINNDTHVHVELDRKTAIRWAWQNSDKNDLILLAGKGHEDYLEFDNKRIAYSERAFVRQLFEEAAA